MRRLWPKGAKPEDIPADAEGVTWAEWQATLTARDYDDPVRRRDLGRARAEQEKKLAAKRGAKRK